MCMHCSRVVWWSLCNALDMTSCACELCKVPIHVASARLARKSRAHFRAKAQHARYCTYMIFTCGNNRPPSDTDWSLEWHDILHQWNVRVQDLLSAAAIKPWSRIVCKQHWDLFCYVAQLPEHRWVRRMLAWNPAIRARQLGRPRHTWDQKVAAFCRYKQLRH